MDNKANLMFKEEIKIMVLIDAFFGVLYLFWDWSVYSMMDGMYQVGIQSHFPWSVQFGGTKKGYDTLLVIDPNFGLLFLVLIILINLYLAYRIQKKAR